MTSDGQREDAGPAEVHPEAVVVETAGAEETTAIGSAVDSTPAAAFEAAGEAPGEEESNQRAEESGGKVEGAADPEDEGGEDQAASPRPQSMKTPHISMLYDKQVGQASLS